MSERAPVQDEVIPAEGWLLLYWDPRKGRWVMINEGIPIGDRTEIAPRANTYRRYMGAHRVRLLHTADG